MGHLLSKHQRMLPAITTELSETSVIKEANNQLSVLEKSSIKPTSVVITIRMLKMEPSDCNHLNNLNQNSNCFCANETHQCANILSHQQQQQLANTDCAHNSRISNQTNNQQLSNRQSNNIGASFNINVFNNQISTNYDNDVDNDDDDNSNIIIGHISQCNNNNLNSSIKMSNKSNSLNIQSKNNICDTSNNHISTTNYNNDIKDIEFKLNNIDVNNYKTNNMNIINSANVNKMQNVNLNVPVIVGHHHTPIIGAAGSATVTLSNQINNNNLNMTNSNMFIGANSASATSANGIVDRCRVENSLDGSECEENQCGHCQRKKSISPMGASKWNRYCKLCSKETKEGKNKKPNWALKLNCAKLKNSKSATNLTSQQSGQQTPTQIHKTDSCVCTAYKKFDEQQEATTSQQLQPLLHPNLPEASTSTALSCENASSSARPNQSVQMHPASTEGSSPPTLLFENLILLSAQPLLDFSRFNPDDYPIEDCDEKARIQRALEIAVGVEPPPGYISTTTNDAVVPDTSQLSMPLQQTPAIASPHCYMVCGNESIHLVLQHSEERPPIVHSQVDYIHCLVPDLKKITNCCFYWGKMDRYEAERLLEGKPEGTFLLRDSAQEEFLFSVSFRKYGRSLHARIEQFNHKFSFDCHDPGVFTSSTVTGLLEHYKDPTCVMFFEPALTLPLNRNFCFTLQQLCRATIVSHTTYDGVTDIILPTTLKSYLKEYHYKQRVRVKRYDDVYSIS